MHAPRSIVGGIAPAVVLVMIASCGSNYGGEDSTKLPTRDGSSSSGDDASEGGTQPMTDAGVDATPTTDASVGPCDLTKPFGLPVALAELNTADIDILSSVSADELTAYVGTNHAVTGFQQFYATRPSTVAAWGPLQLAFPTGAWDNWGVTVTPDGLTAVVSSDRNGNNSELYVATRASTLAAFGALALIAGATNSSANEEGPHWSADGKTLYFDSTRGGNRDLYRVALSGSGFGAPEAIVELKSSDLDAVPVVSADELTIYFLSTRPPTSDGDIYVATRANKGAPFGAPERLAGVNSKTLDAPTHVSADGCRLYMTSARAGNEDAYLARRPK